jgi:hypothetical protein
MHKDLPSNEITMTAATAQPVQWTTSQSQFDSRHGTFFFPPRRLDRLCGPPSLLFNGYPTQRLRMSGANLPCTPSCLELLIRHSYTAVCLRCAPYVVVKWLADTAVSRIRTGPLAGYRDWTAFAVFLCHQGQMTGQYLKLEPTASFHIPSRSLFTSHVTIRRHTFLTPRQRSYIITLRMTFRQLPLIYILIRWSSV